MNRNYLPVAFRALVRRPNRRQRRKLNRALNRSARWPEYALIFDTETSVDPTQRLLFGRYRYCRRVKGRYRCIEEGLFYADDLPERDAAAYAILRAYASQRCADVAPGFDQKIRLSSRREQMDQVFWPAAYIAQALVVGFNLPFDLTRLAVDFGEARGSYRGGFSLTIWEYWDRETAWYREHPYLPRTLIKHIDSKRSLISFGSANVDK